MTMSLTFHATYPGGRILLRLVSTMLVLCSRRRHPHRGAEAMSQDMRALAVLRAKSEGEG